jgi:demethylmenaquinone methyltransferase / 2-methoxy-6-polyprenyl-1,4-benzoquinol methylase
MGICPTPSDQAAGPRGVRTPPPSAAFRKVDTEYLMKALPSVAWAVSSPDSYVYLAEPTQAWPGKHGLATEIGRSGWRSVEWRNLTGGIVAPHRPIRPA